jgi:hypothetical protein
MNKYHIVNKALLLDEDTSCTKHPDCECEVEEENEW